MIELIEKKNPWLVQDAGARVIAVVWSPLSVSDTGDQGKSYYYAEPATGRRLNLGIAGGHDEWSWFVTYVIKNPMPVSYSHGILQATATFQVEESGNVVKVWCDNA